MGCGGGGDSGGGGVGVVVVVVTLVVVIVKSKLTINDRSTDLNRTGLTAGNVAVGRRRMAVSF